MKKKQRPRPAFRPLSFESLESRLPLAGDVTIAVKSGSLTINGDNGANEIAIVQTAPGSFTINGLNGESFKQKGQANTAGPVLVTGVTKNITVKLKGGDDKLAITGLGVGTPLAAKLTVKLGAGDDEVTLKNSQLTGALSINTGNSTTYKQDGYLIRGIEKVTIDAVNVLGKTAAVTAGNGDDQLLITNFTAKKATVKTGAGDDLVGLSNVTVDTAAATLGAGDDDFVLDGLLTLKGPKKSKINGSGGLDFLGNAQNLAPQSVALATIVSFEGP